MIYYYLDRYVTVIYIYHQKIHLIEGVLRESLRKRIVAIRWFWNMMR